MHELSIAQAVLHLADRYRPSGASVRRVHVQAGPLRAIDGNALHWAWLAVRGVDAYAEAALRYEPLPWQLKCRGCDRALSLPPASDPWRQRCQCGSSNWEFADADALLLVALDVIERGEVVDGGAVAPPGNVRRAERAPVG